jgi:hypothetical protein
VPASAMPMSKAPAMTYQAVGIECAIIGRLGRDPAHASLREV